MDRITYLKNRMMRADDSGAGKAAKAAAAKELRQIVTKLYAFADKKPHSNVAGFIYAKADDLSDFVVLQLAKETDNE